VLIDEIEHDALDSKTRVADALRKCIALGGQAGSEELRQWANKELRGYSGEDPTPRYRTVAATIALDAVTGNTLVTGQRIAASALPDVVQEKVSETLELRHPIGEIEELAIRHTEQNKAVHFSLPMGADIARVMNHEVADPYQYIHSLYWAVSPSALVGVVDQVRTTLVELVAELRATMPTNQSVPTPEVAANAVNVAVHGGKRHNVLIAASQSPASRARNIQTSEGERTTWWTPWRKVGATIVGLATVAATIIAWIQLVGE
jgi:hypothetical protein